MAITPLRRANGYGIGGASDAAAPGPVDMPDTPRSAPSQTLAGTKITINDDGSVEIDTGYRGPASDFDGKAFDVNLAEQMQDNQLDSLAMDLLEGIRADIQSRVQLLGNYAKGLDLLGLVTDEEGQSRQRKRTSRIRHPVLLDATVKFWAAASAELLPAAGPCKVRDSAASTEARDDLAAAFERDMNYYLTVKAREYYPDTAQMLMLLGFGGTAFKKVYHCPLRERPVSEAIRLPDLIVNEQATDLENALRVTHQVTMSPVNVRRLQVDGFYRDIDLGETTPIDDPTKNKEAAIHGLKQLSSTLRPQDNDRTLYEIYTDLDLADYGKTERGAPKKLPLPYRVTIDKDSQKILEVRRNWREDDKKYRKRSRFVKWSMVPGFGFLGLGFLHLLGNQAKALTALWRIMIDCGMFAAFPGGVKVKGTRQTTNEIAPGPGEWVEVDTGPVLDIRQALMAMPYKDLNPSLIQLSEMIGAHAEKLGTTVEFPAGEGRTNIPVGTIMAMIEQQTQVMAAVHKGLHRSQQEELLLLKELFAEDPESLWRGCHDPAREWKDGAEFRDCNLVPATDPNVPSQIHRIMIATALVTLAGQNPDIYNKVAVHKHAIRMIGIADVDNYVQPQPPPGPQGPDPELLQKQAELELHKAELALKQQEQQRKAAAASVETDQRGRELELKAEMEKNDQANRAQVAARQEQTARLELAKDHAHQSQDREQKDLHHAASLMNQRTSAQDQLAHQHRQSDLDRRHKLTETVGSLAATHVGEQARMAHEREQTAKEHEQAALDREHEAKIAEKAAKVAARKAAAKPKPKPKAK